MKKALRKTINYLNQYIGHEILRTKPTHGDWSYTSGDDPLLLLGFTSNGCIRYQHTGFDARILGDEEYILPLHFTDRNWITYKKALRAKNNKLNKWKGKKIRRICPTPTVGSRSFMREPVTLISASKHHMLVMYHDYGLDGQTTLLGADYMNPEDWILAE